MLTGISWLILTTTRQQSPAENEFYELQSALDSDDMTRAKSLVASNPSLIKMKVRGWTQLMELANNSRSNRFAGSLGASYLIQHGVDVEARDPTYRVTAMSMLVSRNCPWRLQVQSALIKIYQERYRKNLKSLVMKKWFKEQSADASGFIISKEFEFIPGGSLAVSVWNGHKMSAAYDYKFLDATRIRLSTPAGSDIWKVIYLTKSEIEFEDLNKVRFHYVSSEPLR